MAQQNVNPFFVEDHIVIEPTQKHTGTLIVLHGITSCGKDMKNMLVYMIFPSVKYIFPTAPTRYISSKKYAKTAPAWYDVFDESEDVEGIKKASQAVQELVKKEMDRGTTSDRIMILGYSQGGAVAYFTAITSPFKFASILTWCTRLPLSNNIHEYLVRTNGKFEYLIKQFHGDADNVFSVEVGEQSVRKLNEIGFKAELKIFKGVRHHPVEGFFQETKEYIQFVLVPNSEQV